MLSLFSLPSTPLFWIFKNGIGFLRGSLNSYTEPYEYYQRKYIKSNNPKASQAATRTPWRRIETSIDVDTVSPLFFDGRLYLLWVQTSPNSDANKKSGDNYTTTIKYCSQGVGEAWTPSQNLTTDLPIPDRVNPTHQPPWREVYVLPTVYEEVPAILVVYDDYTKLSKNSVICMVLISIQMLKEVHMLNMIPG